MATIIVPFKAPTRFRFWPANHRILRCGIRVDGLVYADWRHAMILAYLNANNIEPLVVQSPGFVCNGGMFFNRWTAAKIAIRAGQIPGKRLDLVQADDLWDGSGNPTGG